jgi:adenylate cyclase
VVSLTRISASAGTRRYLARAALGLITTIGVLGHVTGRYNIPYIDQMENLLYDTRVRLSAPGGVDDRIVIVAIDEDSLERLGHWPFTREKFAVLMNNLFAYGAAVVAFDVLFAERDEGADIERLRQLAAEAGDESFARRLDEFEPQIDRDRQFAEALQYGPAILGYYFDTNPDTAFITGELPYPAFELHESMMESVFLPRGAGFSSNIPALMQSAYSAGFISNPLIDRDGVVRRTPLLHEYNLAVFESLSLATAATYLNDITLPIFVEASSWMGDYPPLEGLELAGRPIPIDPQGAVLVPYRGPRGSFPYVSFADVVQAKIEDPSILDGRIALIGATAPGMEDLRTTPFGSIYPGVEVHANVIAGLLDSNFRWEPAYTAAAEMITVFAFGVFSALVLPVLAPLLSTLVLLTLTGAALGVNYYMWEVELHVLPLAMTIYTLFAIYTINMLFACSRRAAARTWTACSASTCRPTWSRP